MPLKGTTVKAFLRRTQMFSEAGGILWKNMKQEEIFKVLLHVYTFSLAAGMSIKAVTSQRVYSVIISRGLIISERAKYQR